MDESRRNARNIGAGTKSHARLTLGKRGVDPSVIVSKLVHDRGNRGMGDSGGGRDWMGPGTMMNAYDTTNRISSNIEDIENLKRLNPELDLAMQVQIALILSPKDFINTEINYSIRPGVLPSEMADGLINVLKAYHETSYNIKAKLPDIVKKALYMEGADVWAVIPENSLDDLINGRLAAQQNGQSMTMESLRNNAAQRQSTIADMVRPLGFLGDRTPKTGTMTLESLLSTKAAELPKGEGYGVLKCEAWDENKRHKDIVMPVVYDNPGVLKLPRMMAALTKSAQTRALESIGGAGFGFGVLGKGSSEALTKYFNEAPSGAFPILAIPNIENATRDAIGHPLDMHLPTEAVIPIFEPGAPDKHLAYYVVLDETGSPVTRQGSLGYYRNLYATVDGGETSKLSGLLRQASQDESDFSDYRKLARAREAITTFEEATIRELTAMANNGGGGLRNLSLARQTQAYRIMLARSLSSMQTRILYLPAEMVVYWAYDFNEDGTGRSVLENIKTISGMRALTLMSNLEAQVRNSVDHSTLDITIDPRDPNPQKTRDAIIMAYAQRAGTTIPWASGNPRTMSEWLAMRGTNVNVTGGSNYPETKVDVVARDVALRDVNMDFDESLAKREMMGIGVPPELVDLTTRIEFSSKMATSNDMATKRATVLSSQTNVLLKRDAVTHIVNSRILKDRLIEVIGRHAQALTPAQKELGEPGLLFLFMAYLSVELPAPSNGLRQKAEDFNEFIESLDQLLDSLFNEDVFNNEEGGNMGAQNDIAPKQVKAVLRTQCIVDYCRSNNYMDDVIDILDIDERDSVGTTFAREAMMTSNRVAHIVKALGIKMMATTTVANNQWTAIREAINKFSYEGDGTGEAPEGGGSSDSYSDDGGGDGDFMNDLGLDEADDEGQSDESSQEDEQSEETPSMLEGEESNAADEEEETPPAT